MALYDYFKENDLGNTIHHLECFVDRRFIIEPILKKIVNDAGL